MAYEQSTMTLALLQANFGLGVGGSKYEDVARQGAYFALTGDSDTLDMSGRSLKVKVDGKTTNVTMEDWTNTAKGRSNCIEGMAKALGVTPDKVLEALKRTGHYNGMSDKQIAKSLKVGETLVVRDGRVMTEEEAKGIDWAGVGQTVGKFLLLPLKKGYELLSWGKKEVLQEEVITPEGLDPEYASKVVAYLGLEGKGYRNYSADGDIDKWGRPEVVKALKQIAAAWNKKYPDQPIYYGDLSRYLGDSDPAHTSHKHGMDVDVKFVSTDGKSHPGNYNDKWTLYDRDATRELIQMFLDYDNRNFIQKWLGMPKTVIVEKIFFNDEVLINYFDKNGYEGKVQYFRGHDSHLHIRFKLLKQKSR
ncbi:penicillin-insensitive murein endopeptidase [Thermospira aquatica]|uniref:Penicillin-insensitive murein endopeptidase n=1 Tax=Thermospira aquatica TaxID=2828656 RepID=A0AAX3BE71_9SPIR|nr:penicillin-insensitive murein endopeptidase [Thermospira aquatica]URA10592.1 penicillin-insensitive murein endopeptidase [Thermospira aquatica]